MNEPAKKFVASQLVDLLTRCNVCNCGELIDSIMFQIVHHGKLYFHSLERHISDINLDHRNRPDERDSSESSTDAATFRSTSMTPLSTESPVPTSQFTSRQLLPQIEEEMRKEFQAKLVGFHPQNDSSQTSKPTMDRVASNLFPSSSRSQSSAYVPAVLFSNSLSYQPDSSYFEKVMTTILVECVEANSAAARYIKYPEYLLKQASGFSECADKLIRCDYESAMQIVQFDNAIATKTASRTRRHEAVYWKIILNNAELLDRTTLPAAKGPNDGFSMAEKQSAKKFMHDAGYGMGAESQRQNRILWKSLWEMREAGVEKVLSYRTKAFDSFCKGYPRKMDVSLIDLMVGWERRYRPQIEQLESRVTKLRNGDIKRDFYLDDPLIANQLGISVTAWNNASNQWASPTEKQLFLDNESPFVFDKELGPTSESRSLLETGRYKSLFITVLLGHDGSLSVCSIIPLSEGDNLGVYAGEIRYSDNIRRSGGIQGPFQNLWLDESKVTGVLNQMKISLSNDAVNVDLCWAQSGNNSQDALWGSWTVLVKATVNIKPFDPLVRMEPR